jgi:hypothetical protein
MEKNMTGKRTSLLRFSQRDNTRGTPMYIYQGAIKSQIGKPIVSGSVLHLEKIPAQSVGKNSIQMIYSTSV